MLLRQQDHVQHPPSSQEALRDAARTRDSEARSGLCRLSVAAISTVTPTGPKNATAVKAADLGIVVNGRP
jgi:hypothetical protein